MTPFIFALVASSITSLIMVFSKAKENQENTSNYAVKVFVVSFLVVFISYTYLMGDATSSQEIDIGEPPF
jgi:type III secretory pathway component EscS